MNEKLRICLLSTEFPPETGFGGIGTYTANLADSLAAIGQEVTVLSTYVEHPKTCRRGSILVRRIARHGDTREFQHRVLDVVRSTRFDVVESPDWKAPAFGLLPLCREGLPIVVTCHTPSIILHKFSASTHTRIERIGRFLRPWKWPRKVWFDEISLIRGASEVHCPSKRALRDIERSIGKLPVSRYIPHPFAPLASLAPSTKSVANPRILFLGRFNAHKGADLLPKIICHVKNELPKSQFTLAGNDDRAPAQQQRYYNSMRALLEDQLQHLGDSVRILGRIDPELVKRLLTESHILIVPSRWELWGYVALEAMSLGCAVVATDRGGCPELIRDPEYGRVANPENTFEFARAVIEILSDEQAYNATISRAYSMVVRQASPHLVATQKVDAFGRLLARC